MLRRNIRLQTIVIAGRRLGVDGEEVVGLLLAGEDGFRARGAVEFPSGRGDRRVSWWAHRAELDVVRGEAVRLGSSVSAGVRGWWLEGLPLLANPDVLLDDPGGWRRYVHHLPRFMPRPRGTPRGEWVEWPLPEGVLVLEAPGAGD